MSANYDYVIDELQKLYIDKADNNITCLDFGCGAGQIVEKGLLAGLDFYGADPYPENRSEHYEKAVKCNASLSERIYKIDDGKLPFPDNHFDVVISNVVFEHIKDLNLPLIEIKRVLKPNGFFLALFPTKDTWWEGHIKLYFAHWFTPESKMAHTYFKVAKKLGLGQKSDGKLPDEWAAHYQTYLQEYCFYRSMKEIKQLWVQYFGALPESHAYQYIMFRISSSRRLSVLIPLLENKIAHFLLETICHIRAGRVLLVQNKKL